MLRRIFGPKSNKVAEEWEKLYNGDFFIIFTLCIDRVNTLQREEQVM
jgi:hypothetical protein